MNYFQVFASASDFAAVIGRNENRLVRLWLYNNGSEATRAIDLTPNSGWDGPGSVGCDVLMGALHVIPRRRRVSDLVEERVDCIAGAINIEDLIDEEIELDYAALVQSESEEDAFSNEDEEVAEAYEIDEAPVEKLDDSPIIIRNLSE